MNGNYNTDEFRTSSAERRQVTVLFCDMVGSTDLTVRLDPEDMQELLLDYRRICARAIRGNSGFLAQLVGDGLVAYFGASNANEFDAENAVRAGLQIIENLAKRKDGLLKAHIGISTGTVLVSSLSGEGFENQSELVGRAPNLADRLMKLAGPGEVVIEGVTRGSIGEQFVLKDLGSHEMKGFEEPLNAWKVEEESRVQSRSQEVAQKSRLSSLIAREHDFATLDRAWTQAKGGKGQIVQLSGEAGIGKSRLVRHMKDFVLDDGGVVKEIFFTASQQISPLRSVIARLELDIGVQRGLAVEESRAVLQEYAASRRLNELDQTLLGELLSVDTSHAYVLKAISNEVRHTETLRLLEAHFASYIAAGPVLLILEDMHWGDASSLELIDHFVKARLGRLPMLIVATTRPGQIAPWPEGSKVTVIEPKRLDAMDARRLLSEMPDSETLSDQTINTIIERSDGVPLFLEEVFKSTLEAIKNGVSETMPDAFEVTGGMGAPDSLATPFMARLDRLGDAKRVAQIAAAIGQKISIDLLEHFPLPGELSLGEALRALEHAEILLPDTTVDTIDTLEFRHALLKDVAYASLLKRERRELHAQIARTLETDYPETAKSDPEFMAGHCIRGGLDDSAIDYLLIAGENAFRSSANTIAVRHLKAGVGLLEKRDPSFASDPREIDLRASLARSLHALHGGGAPEVGVHYARARDLAELFGKSSRRFEILIGCWIHAFMSARLNSAIGLANDLLNLAETLSDDNAMAEAYRVSGMTKVFAGEFTSAKAHLEKAIAFYPSARRSELQDRSGLDPIICCETYLALASGYLGNADEAFNLSRRVIASARSNGNPYSLVFALSLNAFLHQVLDNLAEAKSLANEAVAIALQNGFAFWATQQTVIVEWINARTGERGADLAPMIDATSEYLQAGPPLESTRALALLAEAHIRTGDTVSANSALERAVEVSQESGETFYLAEIMRIQGELRCTLERDRASGFRDLERGLEIARSQGATLWTRKICNTVCSMTEPEEPIYIAAAEFFELIDEQRPRASSVAASDAFAVLAKALNAGAQGIQT